MRVAVELHNKSDRQRQRLNNLVSMTVPHLLPLTFIFSAVALHLSDCVSKRSKSHHNIPLPKQLELQKRFLGFLFKICSKMFFFYFKWTRGSHLTPNKIETTIIRRSNTLFYTELE